MAGQVSNEKLGSVLMQAMLAAKNLRPQRDRLLQLGRRLQHLTPGDDNGDRIRELTSDIFKLYYIGIEAGARSIASCLELAAEYGARLTLNPAFATMPDKQLYDALLAQRLPARPTTQAEAFSRVEATFYAVKLSQEHHLPRCIEHLTGFYPTLVTVENSTVEPLDDSSEDDPVGAVTVEPSDDISEDEDEDEDEDDPVGAVTDHLAKLDLSEPATGVPPQAVAKSTVDFDKARDYFDRACTLASLAVKHIDLAVAVISSFLDPKEVAFLSEFSDSFAYISEEGPYPSDD